MTMGKSFNKSILFVLGIILVESAFSGCTDAPENDVLTTTDTVNNLGDFSGKSLEEAYRIALKNPDALEGLPIDMFIIDDSLVEMLNQQSQMVLLKNKEEFTKKHDGIDIYNYEIVNGEIRSVTIGEKREKQIMIVIDIDSDGIIDNYGITINGKTTRNF